MALFCSLVFFVSVNSYVRRFYVLGGVVAGWVSEFVGIILRYVRYKGFVLDEVEIQFVPTRFWDFCGFNGLAPVMLEYVS